MNSQFHIALRYLFAKKTHNVINIISIISATGIAIGSMALILILSVYNGFDSSIREIYESYKADFTITPSSGKILTIEQIQLQKLSETENVKSAHTIVEEKVFVRYGSKETIATIRGIDTAYLTSNAIGENLIEGYAQLSLNEINYALMGNLLAYNLGARVRFTTPLEIYFPKKDSNISITNPLESINIKEFYHGGTFRFKGDMTEEGSILYVSQKAAKELVGMQNNEFSSVEIYLTPDANGKKIRDEIQNILPDSIIKDKSQQNATLYRMMKAEKGAIYLILFFVTAIISINIFSCLSMMIAEKRDDIATFLGLGATNEFIKRIFILHGMFISLSGCLIGVVIGTAVALVQQKFGIVTMPGNFVISTFPVEIHITDIIMTVIGVCSIGFLISYLPAKKIFKK